MRNICGVRLGHQGTLLTWKGGEGFGPAIGWVHGVTIAIRIMVGIENQKEKSSLKKRNETTALLKPSVEHSTDPEYRMLPLLDQQRQVQ